MAEAAAPHHAEAAAHLRVVDTTTGEATDLDAFTEEMQAQLEGAEREIRAWRVRYRELKRDKEAEAADHAHFPRAKAVFDYWRETCNHPKASFGHERFWAVLPFIERHGVELCKRAIDGAHFDPFSTVRRNGTTKRHDGFDLIFRSPEKFEEFANRAPLKPGSQLSLD